MGDQLFAVRHTVAAGLLAHTGLQDLLGPASAHAEHAFQGGAIHPGVGKPAELAGHFAQTPAPDWLIRHISRLPSLSAIMRDRAKYTRF